MRKLGTYTSRLPSRLTDKVVEMIRCPCFTMVFEADTICGHFKYADTICGHFTYAVIFTNSRGRITFSSVRSQFVLFLKTKSIMWGHNGLILWLCFRFHSHMFSLSLDVAKQCPSHDLKCSLFDSPRTNSEVLVFVIQYLALNAHSVCLLAKRCVNPRYKKHNSASVTGQ
jgi:hypothetical protein